MTTDTGSEGAEGAEGEGEGEGAEGAEGEGGGEGRARPSTLEEALERIDELERVTSRATAQASGGRRRIRELEAELAQQREAAMTDDDRRLAEARREGRAEAERELTERLVRSEVIASAAGRLRDPEDALAHLAVNALADEDDDARPGAIRRALDELLTAKPYLAAEGGEGEGNGGGRTRTISQGRRSTTRDGGEADPNAWLRKAAHR